MRGFKVGDKVRRKDGEPFYGAGYVQKITITDDFRVWLDHGLWLDKKDIEHAKTPRKHAELIHRWADDDSMVIECFYPHENDWFIEPLRAFIPSVKYREYDPERKNTERMIEKLETELKELKERLNND